MIVLHSFHVSHTRPSHTVTALQCFMRSVTVLVSCAVCRVLRFAVCFSVRDLSELVDLWHEMLKCTKWQFFTFHLLICGDNRPTDRHIHIQKHTHTLTSTESNQTVCIQLDCKSLKNHFRNIVTAFKRISTTTTTILFTTLSQFCRKKVHRYN